MAETADILANRPEKLAERRGERVLVTAGPTVEDVDAVRFLSNRSTGRMGYRVAETARELGIRSDMEELPSIALGAFEVSPLELASVY